MNIKINKENKMANVKPSNGAIKEMQEKLINNFMLLCREYLREINNAPVRGQYNAVFRTYGKAQRDVKKEFNVKFSEAISMMDYWGVETKDFTSMVPEVETSRSPIGDE